MSCGPSPPPIKQTSPLRKTHYTMCNRPSALTTLAILLALPGAVCAQAPLSVSVHAGLSLAKTTPEEGVAAATYSYLTGNTVDVSVFLPFTDHVGVQAGVGYVQKGTSISTNAGGIFGLDLAAELRTAYVQMPVLLAIHPTPLFRLTAGPAIAFPLTCRLEVLGASVDCDEDGPPLKTDLSVMAGAGLFIPIAPRLHLSVSTLYNQGFTSLFGDSDSKNRGFFFTAGVSIPFGTY